MQRRTSCVFTSLVLQCASASAANLIQNPDFNADTAGWSTTNGTLTLDITSGDPAAPSGHVLSNMGTGSDVYSNCMAVSVGQNVDLIFNLRVNAAGPVTAILNEYMSQTCTGPIVAYYYLSVPSSAWTTYSDLANVSLSSFANSVIIDFQSSVGADYNFDHVLFGATGTAPVRLQSFDVR